VLITCASGAGAAAELEPFVARLKFDRTAPRHIWRTGLKG
jgi:hypothetical protein